MTGPRRKREGARGGFTLIEILVAMGIAATVLLVALPAMPGRKSSAGAAAAMETALLLQRAAGRAAEEGVPHEVEFDALRGTIETFELRETAEAYGSRAAVPKPGFRLDLAKDLALSWAGPAGAYPAGAYPAGAYPAGAYPAGAYPAGVDPEPLLRLRMTSDGPARAADLRLTSSGGTWHVRLNAITGRARVRGERQAAPP